MTLALFDACSDLLRAANQVLPIFIVFIILQVQSIKYRLIRVETNIKHIF